MDNLVEDNPEWESFTPKSRQGILMKGKVVNRCLDDSMDWIFNENKCFDSLSVEKFNNSSFEFVK